MVKLTDVDSLIVNRPIRLGSPELQADLEQSIKEVGIQHPIIVRVDMVVIDGVRRIEAARALGMKKVPVLVTEDFDAIIETMMKAHEDGLHALPADHYRIFYFHRDVRDMFHGPGFQKRFRATPWMKDLATGRGHDTRFPLRLMMGFAFGTNQTRIQSAVFLLNRVFDHTHPDHKYASKVLEEIDDGKYAIHYAGEKVKNLRRALAAPSYDEQRAVLFNSMTTLSTTLKAMKTIHTVNDRFTAEELDTLIEQFMKDRYNLYQMIKLLRRKRGEK